MKPTEYGSTDDTEMEYLSINQILLSTYLSTK